MKIDKIKDQVNGYKCELSFGQLVAIKNALAQRHADPISDELFFELSTYLDMLPQPGEEKKDGEIVPQPRRNDLQKPRGPDDIEAVDLDQELPHPDDVESEELGAETAEEGEEAGEDEGEEGLEGEELELEER
jgi:hypothetical protein